MKNLIVIIFILSLFSCKKAQEHKTTISKKVGSSKTLSEDSLVSPGSHIDKSQKANDIIWQGNYHFEASNKDEAKTSFNIVIKSLDNISVNINDDGSKESYSNVKAELINNDKIKIIYNSSFQHDMGTIYIEKSDNEYYISGNPVYFINPGNNEMPLQKIK
ncbi:hypothetical protein [Chryseobacterium indologenes]|uniref:hypothetical protein n=1 Tax=Chryseobacterium indologenes TaxID=253 RepID=UPI000B5189C7|nr:hypothetical protein [Chryseobacterium indologenes]